MRTTRICAYIITGVTLILMLSCGPGEMPPAERGAAKLLTRVPVQDLPVFDDDLDFASLKTVIAQSLEYYQRIPATRTFALGEYLVSAATLKASLEQFARLLDASPEKLRDRDFIGGEFDVYRVVDSQAENPRQILVTGYYEPVLQGSLLHDPAFPHPIYSVPPDLINVDLAEFNPQRYAGERIVGRLAGNRLLPYYTRRQIEEQGKLLDSNCVLLWLKDPIASFFLHVQGSGLIRLPDGSEVRVGYAGANGRPYRSIGKLLIEKGAISREQMSLQAIRDYLQTHPEQLKEVLWHNESYVFFRRVDVGPMGSLAVPLTAGRSIATDHRYYPKGALAFLVSEKPVLDGGGQVLGWEPLHRWVLIQDTGGAIRGPARVDLFCGSGEQAEWLAGPMKQAGRCYVLLKKGSTLSAAVETEGDAKASTNGSH